MEDFISVLNTLVEAYGVKPEPLVVNLAIEMFKDIRHYPTSYTEEMILADLNLNKSKIAMCIVELDSKQGMENETSHTENGYKLEFSSRPIAYKTVCCIATVV